VAVSDFCPIRLNVVWALDSSNQTGEGRNLKLLNVISENSREWLVI
jgi:hypothetical protein